MFLGGAGAVGVAFVAALPTAATALLATLRSTANASFSLRRKPSPAAVPQTRLGRLARIGLAAAELAAGGAIEGLRGLVRSDGRPSGSALFSAANAQRLAARLANLRGA